jgi:5-methylcytosine-specific restriction endonuclease McrA
VIIFAPITFTVAGYQSGRHKYHRISSSTNHVSLHTYKEGDTRYKYGQTYKTSGLPKVERSASAKKQFLKRSGYTKEPKGMEVDHIIPLSHGGSDTPGNMQLLTKQQHKAKTAAERKEKY